jgi:hypothetical protein
MIRETFDTLEEWSKIELPMFEINYFIILLLAILLLIPYLWVCIQLEKWMNMGYRKND